MRLFLFLLAGSAALFPGCYRNDKDTHGHVRQEAAAALAKIQGKPEPEAVDSVTGEPVIEGQPLSYWIKKMRGGDRGPNDRNFEETVRAQRALIQLGVKAVPQLLESLKGDHQTRFPAITILRELDDPVGFDLLAAALKNDDVRVRSGVAEALCSRTFGSYGPQDRDRRVFGESILRALSAALGDPDADVRWQTARALNREEAGSAEAGLAAALANDPDARVRASAADTLSALRARSDEALEALRDAAKEGPASVREAASKALVSLGEPAPPVTDPAAALRERVEKEGSVEGKKAEYSEITRAPGGADTVIFVIANGGSNVPEFPRTQAMVTRMIKALPAGTRFGVVYYSRQVVKYPPDGKLAQAEGKPKEGGIEFVRATKCGNGSCVHLGFQAAFDMMEAAGAEKAVMVYAGNGAPTCPGVNTEEVYEKESLEEIARRNRGRAAIHTFAGGEWFNAPFLKLLAGMNGGTFTQLNP